MDEKTLQKKSLALNFLGIVLVILSWLIGSWIGMIFFILGAGMIVGVLGGKIVRSVAFKYNFRKALYLIFGFSIAVGLIVGLFISPFSGMILSVIVLVVIGIYNSDMKEALENFSP